PPADDEGNPIIKRFETSPGRLLIAECLPKSHKVPFDIVNRLLTKKEVGDVIDQVYRHTGQKDTVLFADAIMNLGFRYACKAGISFGKDRKSTRLNSSHVKISYAVFCLKKKGCISRQG